MTPPIIDDNQNDGADEHCPICRGLRPQQCPGCDKNFDLTITNQRNCSRWYQYTIGCYEG